MRVKSLAQGRAHNRCSVDAGYPQQPVHGATVISGTTWIETQPSYSPSTILPLETNNAFQSLFYILMSTLVSKESQRVLINACVFKKLWNSSYVQIYHFNSGWPEILLSTMPEIQASCLRMLILLGIAQRYEAGILCWCNSF